MLLSDVKHLIQISMAADLNVWLTVAFMAFVAFLVGLNVWYALVKA
jgi:hypothetical protein